MFPTKLRFSCFFDAYIHTWLIISIARKFSYCHNYIIIILVSLLNTFVYTNEIYSNSVVRIFWVQQFWKISSKNIIFRKSLSLLCNSFILPSVLMKEQWTFIFIYEKFNRTETYKLHMICKNIGNIRRKLYS